MLVLLALAANTSFGGLPVLAGLLAGDNFLPHVFGLRADRRVYRYGIGVLALGRCRGRWLRLASQVGMRHWHWQQRSSGWVYRA